MLIPTLKESPADAEVVSHKLMIRAGMIRQLAAGIYSTLPMGLRVLRKVEGIIREEMDRIGGQEVFLPSIQPAELWIEVAAGNFTARNFCVSKTATNAISAMAQLTRKSSPTSYDATCVLTANSPCCYIKYKLSSAMKYGLDSGSCADANL